MRAGHGARRSPSLRLRVAVASALGASLVVVLLSVVAVLVIVRDPVDQLDDRLLSTARLVATTGTPPPLADRAGLVVTVRSRSTVATSGGPDLPPGPPGTARIMLDGAGYRVLTVPTPVDGGGIVSVAAPDGPTFVRVARRRRLVLVLGAGAILLSAALGWAFAGRAVRPLRRLADCTRALGPGSGASAGEVTALTAPVPGGLGAHGARESEEIAEALTDLLDRVHRAQAGTQEALATARDFAAAADHELRTPLTAMRTDIDVLRDHPDLPERAGVLEELARAQERVETTLSALGALAAGELADARTFVPVELTDLVQQVAEDARRAHAGTEVVVDVPAPVRVQGWPDGLRLALDNLVTNAVRHGRAHRVTVEVHAAVGSGPVVLAVQDDGVGLPVAERDAVLDRFARGSTATAPGSGLGLALVEQQVRRHGGTLALRDAAGGGLRVELELPG